MIYAKLHNDLADGIQIHGTHKDALHLKWAIKDGIKDSNLDWLAKNDFIPVSDTFFYKST